MLLLKRSLVVVVLFLLILTSGCGVMFISVPPTATPSPTPPGFVKTARADLESINLTVTAQARKLRYLEQEMTATARAR